jgi:HD-like signal output (HDOD) protein
LSHVLRSLAIVKADWDRIGYLLEDNTSNITMRLRQLGTRLKLPMISTRIQGGGITLARLASINRGSHIVVCLVTERKTEIAKAARAALAKLGILILNKRDLDAESLQLFLQVHLVDRMNEEVAARLPTPEEIRDRVEKDIAAFGSLPVLPQACRQITVLDENLDSDIKDWSSVIEMDPLSAAQVIRRARSPAYGFSGAVTEVKQAVVFMGRNAVKELVVSGAVMRSLEGVGTEFDVGEYWIHSVGVALASRLLSFPLEEEQWTATQRKDFDNFELSGSALELLRRLKLWETLTLEEGQDPFVGSMMHDIGKVALFCCYPGVFSAIRDTMVSEDWNVPMLTAENTIAGGANHTVVGRILATNWQLGEQVCGAVEQHHAPDPDDRFSQLLATADFIATGVFPFPQEATYLSVKILQAALEPSTGSADSPHHGAERFVPEVLLG